MRKAILILLTITLIFSCSKESNTVSTGEVLMNTSNYDIDNLEKPESLSERFSYAYGNLLAESLERASEDVDPSYFARGFLDYYGTSFYTESEIDAIFTEYQNYMLEEAEAEFGRVAEENLRSAEQFLEVNGRRSGVITTESGLEYEVIRAVQRNSDHPDAEDSVLLDYTMTLLNGQIVDSSYDLEEDVELNLASLVPGAREAIMLMKEGERYRFWIHPRLGYGSTGVGPIGPNELLIFEVELHDIL